MYHHPPRPRTDAAPALHTQFPPEMLQRLEAHITRSETRHSGDIRLCIERSLPSSYQQRQASPRERAVALFGKLRVWDTEHNNGVLIYLLLDERAIEVVADRGLNHSVTQREWAGLMQRLSHALHQGRHEQGLVCAIDEVTELLVTHFPVQAETVRTENLPNTPVLLG